jgi:RNA polymerase sigma-70 factor (ECF subfamily)
MTRDLPYAENQLIAFRPDLLRFARLQLRDDSLAEDVVQEAYLAAMAGIERFANRAALKTWLFSILKNKIADVIRGRGTTINASALGDEDDAFEQVFDSLFKANGHWAPGNRPADWGDPHEAMEQRQFWGIFDACLNHLPANTGRVFMMREFLELDIDEICRDLGISSGNCYVILHRARHQLRGCLEQTWFGRRE